MNKAIAIFMTLALAVGGSAYAAQGGTTTAPAKKPAAQATQTMTGTFVKFDSATNMLTLSTSKGEETFKLGPKASIREGEKTVAAADLGKYSGHQVTVHYVESAGQKMAESVMLSPRPSETKPAGTSGTEKPKPKY